MPSPRGSARSLYFPSSNMNIRALTRPAHQLRPRAKRRAAGIPAPPLTMSRARTGRPCPRATLAARPISGFGAGKANPSPSLAEAFAFAIAKPGARAFLIDENNRLLGWMYLSEAARSGRAFAVEVDKAVLALDADDPDVAHYIESELAPYLADSGFRPVVMASGGEGRRHLFVRVEDPKLRLRFAVHARERRVDVRRVIRPPFAPHRTGLPVALVYPSSAEEALHSLRPNRVRRLPRSLFDLMRRGARTGRDKSDSALLWRIELAAVNAAIPARWLFKALLDLKNPGGKKLQKISLQRGETAARKYFEQDFERARRWVAQHPKIDDRSAAEAELAKVRGALEQAKWTGIGGGTRHDVFLAHLQIARRRGSLIYYASVRELGERAGVAPISASRANGDLERDGWIRLVAEAALRMPQQWSIVPRADDTAVTFRSQGGRESVCNDDVAPPGHDAFRWRALGKAKRLIYRLLDLQHGRSAKDIAAMREVHVRTAQRHLCALARYRLAQCGDDGLWRRLPDVDLEDVAKTLGSFGKRDAERARHRRERESFLVRLAGSRDGER